MNPQRSLVRLQTAPFWASVALLIKGGDPRDVWEITDGALIAKVVNGWQSGARLLVDLEAHASNTDKIAVNGDKVLLDATVTDRAGKPRHVQVFMRAWLKVRIRVSVDGVFLRDDFV
jgi:hypothetical protein